MNNQNWKSWITIYVYYVSETRMLQGNSRHTLYSKLQGRKNESIVNKLQGLIRLMIPA